MLGIPEPCLIACDRRWMLHKCTALYLLHDDRLQLFIILDEVGLVHSAKATRRELLAQQEGLLQQLQDQCCGAGLPPELAS